MGSAQFQHSRRSRRYPWGQNTQPCQKLRLAWKLRCVGMPNLGCRRPRRPVRHRRSRIGKTLCPTSRVATAHLRGELVAARRGDQSEQWVEDFAVMLLSQLVIEVEANTFVEQRYVLWSGHQSGGVYRPVIAIRGSTVTPANCRWCEGKGIDKLARKTCLDLQRRHQSWYRIRYRIESILVNSGEN